MSKNQMDLDMQMPNLSGDESTDRKFAMISDYLFMLAEHQRYLFSNLDARNFNPTGLSDLAETITKPVYGKITDLEGNVTQLKVIEGEISTKLSDAEGNISSLKETAKQLSSKVSNLQGSVSSITQKVGSITLRVANKETSSTIELKAGETTISSQTVQMKGLVTFEALGKEGQTKINGSNITTGTLSAEFIKLNGKFRVYNGQTMGGYIGYMEGSTGTQITNGIGVCNVTSDCNLIATDAGVAINAGNHTFYITKAGGGKLNCKLVIDGEVIVNGAVKAHSFQKT